MKYGLTFGGSNYAMTLEEVALELGVTAQRVQQIEKSALEKMRLAKGDGVVFPSFLPHMVHPVTSVLLVTAVKWLIGGFYR